MGVFDKASLALVPDGIKDGKLYSIKPTDGSGDFIFERGSNLAATRVNSSGLIEKGRENFLLQSNQFDTTWVAGSNVTVTSGQSDRNGTNAAWLLNKSASNRFFYQDLTSSGVQTYSVYVKAGTSSWVRLVANTSNFKGAYFDLSNGATGYVENSIDATIESVGNGWYRCSVIFEGAVTRVRIYPAEQNSTDGTTGSIYIQDAQLEQGLVATDYIETGASTAQAGVLEELPRIDYTGGIPSLLLEPQRTNLITNSEYLGEELTGNRMAINDVVDTSPEGVVNASKLVPDTTPNQTHQSDTNDYGSFVSGDKITISIFAKADGFDGIILRFKDDSGAFTTNRMAIFDLNRGRWENLSMDGTTGVMTGEVGMEDYGNGWYRCFATATADASGDVDIRIPVVDVTAQDTYDETFTGDSTSGVLIYGLQLEAGSYPTSYIPTYGTAATRGEESFEKTGLSSVIGQTEGTIFFEFEYSHQKINNPFFRILEDSSNAYEIIALSNFRLRSRVRIGGSFVAAIDTASVITEGIHKAAIIYKSGDYRFYLDGSLVGSSTENSIVSNPSEINYFNNNNNLKQFLIFPEALSDAECITLTTL